MVLPRLGGSPGVWNTSMVFFQLALLAGYAYAHFSVRWLGVRRQMIVHAAVLTVPFLVLPVALPDWPAPADGWQSPWLIALLGAAVGAPFFALATTSPLLQRWLASTRHEAARDPYFLYASSNAGSLLGLLAYPTLVEPFLPLRAQSRLWAMGYAGFVLLTAVCAAAVVRHDRERGRPNEEPAAGAASPDPGLYAPAANSPVAMATPSPRDRLLWIACAFVPSSLLLAVTHYLTTDVAAIPLLWVAPLAVYLSTFIVAFSQRRLLSIPFVSRMMAIAAVAVALVLLARVREPVWALMFLHIGVLAVAGLLCHGRLAARRPPPRHLTEFYLWVGSGGVLGGAFNALLAPHLFNDVLEYPLAIALACLLRVGSRPLQRTSPSADVRFAAVAGSSGKPAGRRQRVFDVALPASLGLFLIVAELEADALTNVSDVALVLLTGALPTFVCFLFSTRPIRFALGIAVLLGFAYSTRAYLGEIIHAERTFFGVHRVALDPEGRFRTLFHGTTIHGNQSTDPARARESLGYYHASGPAGQVMLALARNPGSRHIALVGLGAGALTVHAAPHHQLTLFEIDPAVVRIAENPDLFSYLANSRAAYETVAGDGRIALSRSDALFDLIVLDAFSSASVLVHLLTREALQLYVRRLAPGGILLFHISTRHLNLEPVLGALARDLGLAALVRHDIRSAGDNERGIFSSEWVLMAREPGHLAPFADNRWIPLRVPAGARVWTDDFANVIAAYRWN